MLRQVKAMLLEKRIGKKTDEGNASGKDNREEDYSDKDCTVDHDNEMPGEINAKFSVYQKWLRSNTDTDNAEVQRCDAQQIENI